MVFTWCGWLWILFTQSRIRPLDAACSHSVFIRNSRQFLFIFVLSKVHSKQFISRCQLQWILHCFSALLFFIFTFFSFIYKNFFCSFTFDCLCGALRERRRCERKVSFALSAAEKEEKKILKASVNNTQVRCKSNVLQVVFLYFSVVQPQGVGVGFFFSGWMWERKEKLADFHSLSLLRSESSSPNRKWISFIDSQGWILLAPTMTKRLFTEKVDFPRDNFFSLLLSNFIFRFLNFSLNFHPMSSCVSFFSWKNAMH